MKPKDVFCVALRIFGVWELITAAQEGAYFLPGVHAALQMVDARSAAFAAHALVSAVLGCVLLQGAPLFANLLYREPRPEVPVE
jgi:hypothetical protein